MRVKFAFADRGTYQAMVRLSELQGGIGARSASRREMAQKPNVENRWWVETTIKKPKQTKAERELPQLPVAMSFYSIAKDYEQERAKQDLTDNNLRIAQAAKPASGDWVYVPMTEEHYPARLVKRIKEEFRLPDTARGIVLDHGRLLRLLICGPQLEDWMIDLTLADEPSVDVYVWGTMYREQLFKRAEEALRTARKWATNLLQYPPLRDDPFRGALL
jgi:hypothetical protein